MANVEKFKGFSPLAVRMIIARVFYRISQHDIITAEKIYNMEFKDLYVDDKDERTTRAFIRKAIEAGYPIGANNFGYFIIETEEQLDETLNRLTGKITGEARRMDLIIDAYENYWRKIR